MNGNLSEDAPTGRAPATTFREGPLASAAATTTVASIVGQAPGFLVPVAIAATLGVSGTTDALFLALAVASFVVASLGAAAPQALIPFVVSLSASREDRYRYLREVGGLMFVLAAGAVVVVFAGSHLFAMGLSGLGVEERRGAEALLWGLAPFVLLSAVSGVWAGALQAERVYLAPALSPAVRSAAVLGLVLWLPTATGAYLVVAGYVLGEIGRAAWLAFALGRSLGRVPAPRLGWPGADVLDFARNALAQIAASAILGITPLVDRLMASWLGPGSVSVLDYAERLWQVPVSLAMSGFLVVSVSEWSQEVHHRRSAVGMQARTGRVAGFFFLASLPLCLGLVSARHWLAATVFGHGRFPEAELARLADTFGAFAVGLPTYLVGLVYTRAFLVLKRSTELLRISAVQLLVKVGLNVILMRYWGLAGIALSTALMYLVATTILIWWHDRGAARVR